MPQLQTVGDSINKLLTGDIDLGVPKLLEPRKLLRRVRQALYLGMHPISHRRCATSIRESGLPADAITPLKYVGDHLALSLRPSERRHALTTHYVMLPGLLRQACAARLADGIEIWRRSPGSDIPDLAIFLEPSELAPMEGELQLRFSFWSDLFVLTFLLAPGDVFGSSVHRVLFIGGIQGRMGSREEVREASRLNDEISPTAMLMLTIQAIAQRIGVGEIIAIGEEEHISLGYARDRMTFDYRRFWRDAGGVRIGRQYRIPFESPQKPLSDVALSHRSRARRRREAKTTVRATIKARLEELFYDLRDGSEQPPDVTDQASLSA